MLSKFNSIFRIFLFMIVLLFFISSFSLQITAENDENKPDLDIIDDVKIIKESSSNNFIESENVEFIIKIINRGDKDIPFNSIITVDLFVSNNFNNLKISNTTNSGLKIGEKCFINISWVPTYNDIGMNEIELYVKCDLSEKDYENNYQEVGTFIVLERPTDIKLIDIDFLDTLIINKKANIITKIRNFGMDSTGSIIAFLNSSVDGFIESVTSFDIINRGEYYNFSFNWTPTRFGSQKITFDFVYFGKLNPTNETIVDVGVENLKWWNDSYHYRQYISVQGIGNVSVDLDFINMLNKIGASYGNFDNKIRIIEYSNSGDIIKTVKNYKFNESSTSNSIGNLIWNVDNNADEHYYCIYFDSDINPGIRTYLQEDDSMVESGNTDATIGFIEGWSIDIINPIDEGYAFYNEPVDIIVETTAKAENVEVKIFWNENKNISYNFSLSDDGNLTRWSYKNFNNFTKEGNWTINISSYDKAGYHPDNIEQVIFIGKPDLDIIEIKYSTNNPEALPTIYINDIVNFSVIIHCYNASLNNIPVQMSIFRKSNDEFIYSTKSNFSFLKNKEQTINFLWKTNTTGTLYIHIELDIYNSINESDELNNDITRTFSVSGWPDLTILEIILPSKSIFEYENVIFNVIIKNIGDWDAYNYTIKLCIYPKNASINKSDYERYRDNFNLKSNSEKQIPLYWDSAEPGEWELYFYIIHTDIKDDEDPINNYKTIKNFIVKSFERDPPSIDDVEYNPNNQIQGGSITINAKVEDDSGINFVEIIITEPSGITSKNNMKKTGNDLYKFIFYDTYEYGKYSVVIYAEDNSFHENNASYSGSFIIYEDDIKPVISFFNAEPYVQLINKNVEIICVANDNIGIEKVKYTIISPDGQNVVKEISVNNNGKYVYENIYNITGSYTTSATIYDYAGNTIKTNSTTFWITKNLDDTDNDGMPDYWEERYGFNPTDASDAKKDKDNDGYTNYEEYKSSTHPTKDIFLQNMSFRIKDNISYLAISIMLFIVLIILGYIGKRRIVL